MRTYVYLKKQKREFNSRPKSEFPWNRHSLTILRSTYLNRRFVPRVDNSNPVSLLADRSIISPSLFALASRASASSKSRGSIEVLGRVEKPGDGGEFYERAQISSSGSRRTSNPSSVGAGNCRAGFSIATGGTGEGGLVGTQMRQLDSNYSVN